MKEISMRTVKPAAVELWVATIVFIFSVLNFISPAFHPSVLSGGGPNREAFENAGVGYNYYQHYLIPLLVRYCYLFFAFSVLNFKLIPAIRRKERLGVNIALAVLLVLLAFGVNMLTTIYLRQYLVLSNVVDPFVRIWQESFVYTLQCLLLFGAYLLVRFAGSYLVLPMIKDKWKDPEFSRERLLILLLWVLVGVFLIRVRAPELFVLWLIGIPSTLLLHHYSFKNLIPAAYSKKRPFIWYIIRVALLAFVSFWLFVFLLMPITQKENLSFGVSMGNAFIQGLIVGPGLWLLFRYQMKGKEELFALKKELGASTANLDFLRSQINPHFLFNALNTIYGTAIQEHAERTGEAVQMLGDMMRFMLQENMQDKISLVRDIAYLQNYINLQKLRTQTSPDINIQVDIQPELLPHLHVAPMLLIPFIENAFKHGISLREPSYIKVALEVKEGKLYFDVYNSKHAKPQHDPEQYHGGIGLQNVRQRLQLLYPGRHELLIRENARDFFVHLMIDLNK